MNEEILSEIGCWLSEYHWDWFITLNPNKATKLLYVSSDFLAEQRALLRHWNAISDNQLLGKNWSKHPTSQRTLFFAFPEKGPMGDLVHWHLAVKSPAEVPKSRQVEAYETAWEKLCPDGQVTVYESLEQAPWYSSKLKSVEIKVEHFIISSEFQNSIGGDASQSPELKKCVRQKKFLTHCNSMRQSKRDKKVTINWNNPGRAFKLIEKSETWDERFENTRLQDIGYQYREQFIGIRNWYQSNGSMSPRQADFIRKCWERSQRKQNRGRTVSSRSFRGLPRGVYEPDVYS